MRRELTKEISVKFLSDTEPDTNPGTERTVPIGTQILLEDPAQFRLPVVDAKQSMEDQKTGELIIIPPQDDGQAEVLRLTLPSWKDARKAVTPMSDTEPPLDRFNVSLNGQGGQAGRKLSYGSLGVAAFPADPRPEDVVQGESGSCFILAVAAASLVPHPQSKGWRPHAWQRLITPVGKTNSLYKVTFDKEGKPSTLYVSSAIPIVIGDGAMAGANPDIKEKKDRTIPAWPAILEKAWIQANEAFAGRPEAVMQAVGMTEVSAVNDPKQIPDLFAKGRAIAARERTTTIRASRPAGVDVKLPFAVSADRDSRLFPLSG